MRYAIAFFIGSLSLFAYTEWRVKVNPPYICNIPRCLCGCKHGFGCWVEDCLKKKE